MGTESRPIGRFRFLVAIGLSVVASPVIAVGMAALGPEEPVAAGDAWSMWLLAGAGWSLCLAPYFYRAISRPPGARRVATALALAAAATAIGFGLTAAVYVGLLVVMCSDGGCFG